MSIRCLAALLTCAVSASTGAEFHVAPSGAPTNAGTVSQPWTLAHALAHPPAVAPGDTIWLHGGTYTGRFVSRLNGTAAAPIVVRQAAGERATIDGGSAGEGSTILAIQGTWTWFWGFEITSSDPKRVTAIAGSWPDDIRRGGGVDTGNTVGAGVGVKLINLVVHDTAQGLSLWRFAEGLEAYGNLIYHNGWQGPDRGHGHGIYTQNEVGTKRIVDNVIFGGFSYGMQAYGSEAAYVDGYQVEGNVFLDSGALSANGGGNCLVGGGRPSRRIVVRDNVALRSGLDGDGISVGYNWQSGINVDAQVLGNYIVGGLRVYNYAQLTVRGNTVAADETIVRLDSTKQAAVPAHDWDANAYFCPQRAWQPFNLFTQSGSFGAFLDEWRTRTGFDATSTYATAYPAQAKVIVRPNAYEPGRAHVIVVGWPRAAEVAVDVSGVLAVGDAFELRDAQDFFAAPLFAGSYGGGTIAVPMDGSSAAQPVGDAPIAYRSTAPLIGVFVLLRTAAAPPGGGTGGGTTGPSTGTGVTGGGTGRGGSGGGGSGGGGGCGAGGLSAALAVAWALRRLAR
ncbi:MAG TPA: hypothetical protein VEL07_00900 [Planctomycetota bacterium]|nr:hypothetical protein [Planctomycetota bacterium]